MPPEKAIAITKQPQTYQEMLNYLLPTKAAGSTVNVPRITTSKLDDPEKVNDFDNWREASKNSKEHTHIGLDLAYSQLNPKTGNVDYKSTTDAANQNVSVGAPVGGIFRFVGEGTNTVEIVTPAGLIYPILHMSNVDRSLEGKTIAPGSHIGTMDGVGANGVKHVHLGVYRNEMIEDADGVLRPSRVYYDPQEVPTLGMTGRYVIKDNAGMTPDRAVDSTPASAAFWRNNDNLLGEGQREATDSRVISVVNGVNTVTATYGGQIVASTYDAAGKGIGGQQFVNDYSQTQGNTGNWLTDAQARQNQSIQSALSVVLSAEKFEANIYNDKTGIPTVGYGYALIDKVGENIYRAKPEADLRTSLRLAGVDETVINKIKFDDLRDIAANLTAGKRSVADALTATLTDTKIFANKEQAELQVVNRLAEKMSALTKALGGSDVVEDLNTNQIGALLSLYDNSPVLIGKNLVKAIQNNDSESIRYEIASNSNLQKLPGLDIRREKEAALFENQTPVSGGTFATGGGIKAPAGHWEEVPAQTDQLTGYETAPATRVWVGSLAATTTQSASTTTNSATPKPPVNSLQDSDVNTVPADPANPKGEQLTITSTLDKDGKLITVVANSDGEIILTAQPDQTLVRDPETGKLTVTAADGATQSYNPQTAEFASTPAPEATSPEPSEGSASTNQSTSGLADSAPNNNDAALKNEDPPPAGNTSLLDAETSNLPKFTLDTSNRGVLVAGLGDGLEHLTSSAPALQKIPLPSGGYIIANEDGEIVGSGTPVGTNGLMRVEDANGERHFQTAGGVVMTDTQAAVFETTGIDLATPIYQQYNPALRDGLSNLNAGVALSNAVNNWEHLTDLQRASALLAAYNSAVSTSTITDSGGGRNSNTPPEPTLGSQIGGAVNLLMSAQQLGHWDQMSDMGRAQAISSLVSSGNSLAQSFNSGSKDFGQSMGEFAAGLSFADALAHGGDRAIVTSGLQFANAFNGAADQVISNWVGNAATDAVAEGAANAAAQGAAGSAGSTVPYVGIAIAVMNFEQNPGAAIGSFIGSYWGPVGSMVGSMIGGALFGGGSKPPPPEGEIHFEWSASSGLHIVMDKDVGGAGSFAVSFASSVKSMMEGVVGSANEKSRQAMASGEPAQALLALNPFKLPRMGVNQAGAWIEVTLGDGHTVVRENVNPATFGKRVVEILQDSGALTSQWEVDSIQAHYAIEVQTNPAEALAHARAGMGGHAGAGNQAFAIQGNAVESADFKTQSFGALVITPELTQTLNHIKTINVLINADQDNYIERSEWVSGTDEQGNPQGVLVLDFNGNGQIETRDILNLNGNTGQDGNHTDEALQATANAALQRNNTNWLDANSDGVLDNRDPAFAAIKLLIDINNNGRADDGELQSLDQASITAINLRTGQVSYSDGHTSQMTATTLTAQTSGDKQTQIQEVQEDGTLKTLNAGQVIEHEGYQGQVQMTDDGGTRWVGQREHTYDHQALRTGDWEGTDEAAAHRSGGGNVLADGTAAPTETTATGTINLGKVKTAEQKPNAVQLVTGVTVTTGAALGFVPLAAFAGTTQSTIEQVTNDMIQSAGSTLFGGAGGGASSGGASAGGGLGALGAVGAGMGSGAPVVASVVNNQPSSANIWGLTPTAPDVQPNTNTDTSPEPTVFVAAGINNFQSLPATGGSTAPSTPTPTTATIATVIAASPSPQPSPAGGEGLNAAPVRATVVSVTPAASSPAPTATPAPIPTAPVLQAPTLQSETVVGTEDTTFRIASSILLANDTSANAAADPSKPIFSITSVANPTHGQVGLNNGVNGLEVVFIPDANFHGTATFSYTATDQYGLSSTATATLQIAAVNDLPVATGETTQTDEDTAIIFTQAQLLVNDTDVDTATDGQVLSISAVLGATNGAVVMLANGDIKFTPNANYHGAAQFTYTVSDGNGGTADASVNLTVLGVNDAPVATGEALNGAVEDTTLLIAASSLLANDTDVDTATDGQVLTIQSVSGATHGTVSLITLANGSQQINFVPDANYNGAAQFSYTVTDGNGATSTAIATLTIAAVNDAPITANETAQTDEDVGLLFTQAQLLANDTDVDTATNGQVLSVSRVGLAQHGTALMDAQGQVRFVPDANYHGAASFTYWVSDGSGGETPATVNVTVLAVNDAPVATGEALNGAVEDTTLLIAASSLLANDTDVDTATDGQVLTIQSVSGAIHGTVSLITLADGSQQINFVPDANYNGAAQFSYTVTDGNGATSTAIATLTIAAVNDAPIAMGEAVNTNEDTTLLFNQSQLLANDTDVDTVTNGQVLTISAVSNAQHGTVSILANGQIQFVPERDYFGVASFDYTVDDGAGGTSVGTTTVNLAPVNDAPVSVAESVNGTEDTTLVITAAALLANDSDVDNLQSSITLSRVQSGTGGTATLNANGTVSFVPNANFNGAATFTYWVKDSLGAESEATTTTINLAAVNDAPYAQGEVLSGAIEDAVFQINTSTLLANDGDVDNANSDLSIVITGATHGSAVMGANGVISFTPTANYYGAATISYKVRDPAGLLSPTVQSAFSIGAVNDAPVGVDDQFTTYKNSTMTIAYNQLTGNDTDVDGDTLTVSGVRNASHGTVSIVNGQVQFVPDSGYTGAASFQYLVDDSHGGQTWANAAVQVNVPPNQYPTVTVTGAGFDWYNPSVHEVRSFSLSFAVNDDGNAAAVSMSRAYSYVSTSGGQWDPYSSGGASLSLGGGYGSITLRPTYMTWDYEYGWYASSYAYFNDAQTAWYLTDDRGLTNTMYVNVDRSGANYSFYFAHSGYYYPPVVLDLDGNGVQFTSINDSKVQMDVNFDGIADKMAWAGNDDGVLVWDKDQNLQITDASEIGFHKLKEGAQTDLEGLQALDTNGNGLLDAGDEKFAQFAVWQDKNGNGVTDAGEFKTLLEQGIASINLHSNAQVQEVVDVMVMGEATFTRTDGSTGAALDVMLAYQPGQADINRMALLFNQVVNTAVDIELPSLGYVPIGMESADPHVQDFANLQDEHNNKT